MHGSSASDGRIKWWLSGGAAFALHAAVVLALPDTAPRQPSANSDVVSFTWVEGTPSFGSQQDMQDTARARSKGSAAPVKSASLRAHAKAETAQRKQARPASAAVDDMRQEPADEEVDQAPSSALSQRNAVALAEASALVPSASTPSEAQTGDGSQLGAGAVASSGADQGTGLVGDAMAQGSASRAPSLIAAGNPCRGYFPSTARADHGRVQIRVGVDVTGHASDSQILIESPVGQEFGSAARACAAALRFEPAADGLGAPIAGVAKLELRFDRS
jgi:hypothetical protein